MLWALSFIATFLIGGVTDLPGRQWFGHLQRACCACPFSHTFYPIAIIGVFAGITYWFPKMYGRHLNEFWGRFTLHNHHGVQLYLLTACSGRCRLAWRIFNFRFPELSAEWMLDTRRFATIALCVMLVAQFIFLANFYSMFKGKKAGGTITMPIRWNGSPISTRAW